MNEKSKRKTKERTTSHHDTLSFAQKDQIRQLQTRIDELSTKIKALPPGMLQIGKAHGKYQWFYAYNHKRIYIPQKNRQLAKELAYKALLTYELDKIECQFELLKRSIPIKKKHYDYYLNRLIQSPGFRELLPYHYHTRQDWIAWEQEDYERNSAYPEHLIHQTMKGDLVRSKSESMIADSLYEKGIPYRYEWQQEISGVTLHPDFTIVQPTTGKLWYWEHCGMMDDEIYLDSYLKKHKIYINAGFLPGVNMIYTYEDKQHPFNMNQVQSIFHQCFLKESGFYRVEQDLRLP